MPRREIEPTIPVFERAKAVHTADGATTVIGSLYIYSIIFLSLGHHLIIWHNLHILIPLQICQIATNPNFPASSNFFALPSSFEFCLLFVNNSYYFLRIQVQTDVSNTS
jgi:hypothetical protein